MTYSTLYFIQLKTLAFQLPGACAGDKRQPEIGLRSQATHQSH